MVGGPAVTEPFQHESKKAAEFLRLFLAAEIDIRAFIRAIVRDSRDVDDVFQSVAVVLLEKFDQYDRGRSFGAWARGIAAKEVLMMWRKNGKSPTPFSPEIVNAIKDSYEQQLPVIGNTSERLDALEQCIGSLPGSWREMLDYRYRQALPIRTVAEKVGKTFAATQRALSRMHRRLAECVESRLAITKGDAK